MKLASMVLFSLCALQSGCGTTQPSTHVEAPRAQPAPAQGPATSPLTAATESPASEPPPEACTQPPPAAMPQRDQAAAALIAGEARTAATLFSQVAAQHPQDLGSELLATASSRVADELNRRAAQSRVLRTVELAAIRASLEAPASQPSKATPAAGTRLSKTAEKKNLIVDDARWFADNALPRPTLEPSDAPEHTAAYFRSLPLTAAYVHLDHAVARYGAAALVASAPGRAPRAFLLHFADDDSAALEPTYARLVGNVLLVQLSYNGYASANHGHNGYLATYDAESGALLWLSEPRVANASSFAVTADAVITGYGFTSEPDYLHVLDLGTGAVRERIALKTAPSHVIAKQARLFVRTGGTDYVFRLPADTQGPLAAQLLESESAGAAPETAHAQAAARGNATCWLRAALTAIDLRDPTVLSRASAALSAHRAEHPVLTALALASRVVEAPARGEHVIDLWSVAPVRLAAPAWRSVRTSAPLAKAVPAPKLVKRLAEPADPVRTLDVKPYSSSEPYFLAPVEDGVLPEGARPDIPSHYARESLRAIIPSGEHTLLVYGGRYIAVLRGSVTEQVLDLDAFRHPPKPNPQWAEFAVQDVTYAQLRDGTLYVCNGGGSYARDVGGKKGFITALDLASQRIEWRSEALVCNAQFALSGDRVLTGYGFADEPDFFYVLNAANGGTLAKSRLDSAPEAIGVKEGVVTVEAYAHRYEFELR